MIVINPTERHKDYLKKAFAISKRFAPFGETSVASLTIPYMIIPKEYKVNGLFPIEIMKGKERGWLYDHTIYFFAIESQDGTFSVVLRASLEERVHELLKEKVFAKTASEVRANTLVKNGEVVFGMVDLKDLNYIMEWSY